MGIGLGVVLLVLGLILVLRVVQFDIGFVDDVALGWIFLIAGVLAVVLALVMNKQRSETRHVEERRYNAGLADVESRWMYLAGKTADLAQARPDLVSKAATFMEAAHVPDANWPLRDSTLWTEVVELKQDLGAWAREGQAHGRWWGSLADLWDESGK